MVSVGLCLPQPGHHVPDGLGVLHSHGPHGALHLAGCTGDQGPV